MRWTHLFGKWVTLSEKLPNIIWSGKCIRTSTIPLAITLSQRSQCRLCDSIISKLEEVIVIVIACAALSGIAICFTTFTAYNTGALLLIANARLYVGIQRISATLPNSTTLWGVARSVTGCRCERNTIDSLKKHIFYESIDRSRFLEYINWKVGCFVESNVRDSNPYHIVYEDNGFQVDWSLGFGVIFRKARWIDAIPHFVVDLLEIDEI